MALSGDKSSGDEPAVDLNYFHPDRIKLQHIKGMYRNWYKAATEEEQMQRRKSRQKGTWRCKLEACTVAGEMLKSAGFELRYVSMSTESCYYAWPGREETIRIAAHRKGRGLGVMDNVVAKLTMSAEMTMASGGIPVLPKPRLHDLVAGVIGRYFLIIKLGASGVMEAAPVLGTGVSGRGGSSPLSPTNGQLK